MSNQHYDYITLPSPRHIRLLHIEGDSQGDSVRAKLVETSLDSQLHYVALSYVWGRDESIYDLFIGEEVFKIRWNLFLALKRLRKRRARAVWVDAICINQNDAQERADQVRKMREIYERANEVVFYLGEFQDRECQDIDYLLNLLFKFAMSVLSDEEGGENKNMSDFDVFRKHSIFSKDQRWRTLIRLLEHPWFSRVWVIQESAVTSNGVFLFGNSEWPQEMFNTICRALNRYADFASLVYGMLSTDTAPENLVGNAISRSCQISMLRPGIIKRKQDGTMVWFHTVLHRKPLIALLRLSMHNKATDPRDQVFALLGISKEAQEEELQPSYEKIDTRERTFMRVAKYMVENGYGLQLLQQAGSKYQSQDLPTWVPRWDDQSRQPIFKHAYELCVSDLFRAGGLKEPTFSLLHRDRVLVTKGICFDTIKEVGSYMKNFGPHSGADVNGVVTATFCMLELADMLRPLGTYPTNEPLAEVIYHVAICGRWNGDAKAPEWLFMSLLSFLDQQISLFPPCTNSDLSLRLELLRELKGVLDRNRIPNSSSNEAFGFEYMRNAFDQFVRGITCVTAKGYACQIPRTSNIGDTIVLLQGSEVPYVLRDSAHNIENTHILIGQCYVHGLMYGCGWNENEVCNIYIS